MSKEYLKEPIIPRKSIGGVNLGDSYDDVLARLGGPSEKSDKGEDSSLTYPGLSIAFRHGVAFQLEAEEGYEGKTPDGVYVGMSWKTLKAMYGELKFDCDECYFWFVPGIEGLGFDIARPPRPHEQPIEPPYVGEVYEVMDVDNAFVRDIYVLDDELYNELVSRIE